MGDRAVLDEVIAQLSRTGAAAEVMDAEWRLVWVSPQLRVLLGRPDDEALGIGRHWLETRDLPAWRRTAPRDVAYEWTRTWASYLAYDTPGGLEGLMAIAGEERRDLLRTLEVAEPPPLYAYDLRAAQGDLPPARVGALGHRIRDASGDLAGTAVVYSSGLPATVLALVARGDPAMFERMAELTDPGRRAAAVLFADLEASARLSRRLSSAAYFRLVRAIATGFDAAVGGHGGIVGKHAGDGVTAFFLAEQLGSEAAAVRAALETARASVEVAREAADALAGDGVRLDDDACRLNLGLHWGGGLFMGQVVTDGRLEVTALGDEVNECARIEQSARGGEILASKALVERLAPADASRLGLDPAAVGYRPLAELDSASDKALRDAGTIPVTDVRDALLAAGRT